MHIKETPLTSTFKIPLLQKSDYVSFSAYFDENGKNITVPTELFMMLYLHIQILQTAPDD